MLMNYHELTMGQPRNSESNRKQYLVICTVMAAAFCVSVLQAGGLSAVATEPGTFPGGKLVYKSSKRDYAAAASLNDAIAKEANLRVYNETADTIFSVYLDDPALMSGRRLRFACGLLDSPENDMKDRQAKLLESNIGRLPPTKLELEEDGAHKLWPKLEYKETTLPAAKALVVQFPFTNGFVSAIVFSYKVLPAMRRAALEAGAEVAVVVSTCSEKDSMCTHYAPLESSKAFMFGQADTQTYLATLGPESRFDVGEAVGKLQRRLSGWFKSEETKQEL